MALFRPMSFGLLGDHLIRQQARSECDPDDPNDDDYLRQTQRQSWVSYLLYVMLKNVNLDSIVKLQQKSSNCSLGRQNGRI